ncbi:MAG TPA: hypothetical protein VGF59_19740 [Bryobacteraceae bacterium]
MMRLLGGVAVFLAMAGALSASPIMCWGTGSDINNCMMSNSLFWADKVDWYSALGAADNTGTNQHATGSAWTGLSQNGITVSLQASNTLGRFDNVSKIFNGSIWQSASTADPNLQTFRGNFDAPPNTAGPEYNVGSNYNSAALTDNNAAAANYGDHLVKVMGGSDLTLDFSTGIEGLGFRISASQLATFDVTMALYSDVAHTSLAGFFSASGFDGGGDCAALDNSTPAPCNIAPLVGWINSGTPILSAVIHTNDAQGFLIDTLFLQTAGGNNNNGNDPTPEPAVVGLVGAGLLAIVVRARRRTQA